MPCRSERPARSRSTVPPHFAGNGRIESCELLEHRLTPLGEHRLRELLEHRAKPSHDLDRRVAVLADLGHAEREVVRPAANRDHEAAVHVADGEAAIGQVRLAHEPEQVLEVIQHLHGRRRVVHGRRERADRDVDHDPDRERRILLDRPLDTERDHRAQAILRVRRRASARRPRSEPPRRTRSRRPDAGVRRGSSSRAPRRRARGSRSPGSRRRASSRRRATGSPGAS